MMTSRVNNINVRTLAERMYVEEGLTAKSIALAVSVSEQTLSRWKKGISKGDINWDEKRKKHLEAPHNIKRLINEELSKLAQGEDPKLDMKAIKDAIAAMEGISHKISAQVIYSVFREFDLWMSSQDPDKALDITQWHKEFLLYKAQNE